MADLMPDATPRAAGFGPHLLALPDPPATARCLADGIRREVRGFRRRGAVVALSGGVDSSVVAALAARALGPERVLALLLPERESSPDTLRLARLVAERFGVATELEDITGVLEAAGCYARRDAAIRRVVPGYGEGWRAKLVRPSVLHSDALQLFHIVVEAPDGSVTRARLPAEAYLQVVAATNFKQRTRKMLEYYHADRSNYAVLGTPNRLEYDQGFFVKNGDGSADVKPIAHLYKTQVYQLAEALGVPREITSRPPTTDTYSMPQSQTEFYFSLPFQQMDLCLYAVDHGVSAEEAAPALGLAPEQVARVFRDIAAKRQAAAYLHAAPRTLGAGPADRSAR